MEVFHKYTYKKTHKMNNTITINGINYKVKQTIRALFIFEQITKKPFKIETLLDNYIYLYSIILANNEKLLNWDEFINALDEDKSIYEQLMKILDNDKAVDELMEGENNEDEKGEKKN